jgi:hypothetical protein
MFCGNDNMAVASVTRHVDGNQHAAGVAVVMGEDAYKTRMGFVYGLSSSKAFLWVGGACCSLTLNHKEGQMFCGLSLW